MSTSVSTRLSDSASAAKTNRLVKRVVIVCAAILLCFLLFVVIRVQGHVTGQEFSPTHFQQRRFSFYEIPLIHVQITPIKRAGSTPSTATYLRQNGLTRPVSGAPVTWHLVSIARGVTGSTPADAGLLMDQLKLEGATTKNGYWRQWTIDNPKHAKVLWSIIQTLAERELYILMPGLFEIAQLEQTPAELQQRIDERLRADYLSLIKDMSDAGRNDLAEQLLAEAIKAYPDDAGLKNLRLNPSN